LGFFEKNTTRGLMIPMWAQPYVYNWSPLYYIWSGASLKSENNSTLIPDQSSVTIIVSLEYPEGNINHLNLTVNLLRWYNTTDAVADDCISSGGVWEKKYCSYLLILSSVCAKVQCNETGYSFSDAYGGTGCYPGQAAGEPGNNPFELWSPESYVVVPINCTYSGVVVDIVLRSINDPIIAGLDADAKDSVLTGQISFGIPTTLLFERAIGFFVSAGVIISILTALIIIIVSSTRKKKLKARSVFDEI